MFRLPALPGRPLGRVFRFAYSSRVPVVSRRVPVFRVDFRSDLSSQLPVHGTLSARREAWTSDLGVEHQPPEAWASGQANYARRPRSQNRRLL